MLPFLKKSTCDTGNCETLQGTATLSSTYGNEVAANGNDGDPTSMANTNRQINPWFQVDFGSCKLVERITFQNRPKLCASRLFTDEGCHWQEDSYAGGPLEDTDNQGATFGVSNHSCSGNNCALGTVCHQLMEPNKNGTYSIECKPPVRGRYAYVILKGSSKRCLNFMEFSARGPCTKLKGTNGWSKAVKSSKEKAVKEKKALRLKKKALRLKKKALRLKNKEFRLKKKKASRSSDSS